MAYKQKNYFEYRDSLASGEPDKVIKGLHFDEEFGAIEKAFENVTGDILVEEIEGLSDLLDDKVSKTDTDKQSVQSELEIKNELVVRGNQDPDAFPVQDSPAYLSVNPEDRKAHFSPYYPQVGGDAADGWDVELSGTLEINSMSFPPRAMWYTYGGMVKYAEGYIKWQEELRDHPIEEDRDEGWVIKPNLFVDQNLEIGGDINVEGSINIDGNIIGGDGGIDIGKEISDLNDGLTQEIKDREEGDKLLQGQIDDLDTGKADLSALNEEIKAREEGDNAINERIDNLKVADLADTDADTPNKDEFLIYDGAKWVAEEFHIDTELQFKGGISVPNDPAPAAEHGDLYVNNEEGLAGASWTGIAGRQINPANAVGWVSDNPEDAGNTSGRWYMLGDIATTAVTEIREGTAIKVDATEFPSKPIVSLDKALTNSWYAHQVTSKTDSGINVSVSVDAEGYVNYDVSADIRELGEDFAPADKAYMYTDQANACTPDFTIDCQNTTITNNTVSSASIDGEYFSARLDDSFFNIQDTFAFTNRAGNALFIDGNGEGITAVKIKKLNGTSDQLLCADGSVATKTEVGGQYQLPVGKGDDCALRWTADGWAATDYLTIDDENAIVRTAGDLVAGLSVTASKFVKSLGTANQLLCADGSVVDKDSVGAGQYSLPLAANGTRGGVQVGFTTDANARNYAVQLSGEKMYVTVPWTDTDNNTTYSQATSTTLGLVKIGATGLAAKNYAVQLNGSGQMYVAVPWTDSTGFDNYGGWNLTANGATSGKITANATVDIRGDGGTTVSKSGNTITISSDASGGGGGLPDGDWHCTGNITAAGNITAYKASDERLKDDIAPMPLGLIDGISPVTFKWKDSGKSSGGVIAQQLQACGLDDWVNEAPNGDLGVDYNALIGVLLAEVLELKARVREMENANANP